MVVKTLNLRWHGGTGAIKELKGATNLETNAWKSKGVVVSAMGSLPATLYTGMAFDNNTAVIVPYDPDHLPAIWCFCSSPEYNEAVRRIDQTLKVTNATLVKVPFDLAHWTKVAQENTPMASPSRTPTTRPNGSSMVIRPRATTPLQVAVARLLGYRWPAEQDSAMELSDDARAWVEKSEILQAHADRDGIVCIPAVRGERPAAERFLDILRTAYGRSGRTRCCTSCSPRPAAGPAPRSTIGCATDSSSSTASASTTGRSSGTSGTVARTASPAW